MAEKMTALDVKDELLKPIAKLTVLLDLMNNDRPADFTKRGKDGLYTILDEVLDTIREVHEAEIVLTRDETRASTTETTGTTGTDFRARFSAHWPAVQKHANEADARVKALLAFVAEIEDQDSKPESKMIHEAIYDVERILEDVAGHTAALRKVANDNA
jgi:hypothetical protein